VNELRIKQSSEAQKADALVQVLLFNDDRSLQLVIGFLGWSQDHIEEYLTKNIIESKNAWPKKYTQMKYI